MLQKRCLSGLSHLDLRNGAILIVRMNLAFLVVNRCPCQRRAMGMRFLPSSGMTKGVELTMGDEMKEGGKDFGKSKFQEGEEGEGQRSSLSDRRESSDMSFIGMLGKVVCRWTAVLRDRFSWTYSSAESLGFELCPSAPTRILSRWLQRLVVRCAGLIGMGSSLQPMLRMVAIPLHNRMAGSFVLPPVIQSCKNCNVPSLFSCP